MTKYIYDPEEIMLRSWLVDQNNLRIFYKEIESRKIRSYKSPG